MQKYKSKLTESSVSVTIGYDDLEFLINFVDQKAMGAATTSERKKLDKIIKVLGASL
jgi:hypothetical protein